jgi:hypothetical protein
MAPAVDKFLFYITCTTCQARLKVRDPKAIGIILACPKCESMVQVTPPSGWELPADNTVSGESPAPASTGGDSDPSLGGVAAATPVVPLVAATATAVSNTIDLTAPPVVARVTSAVMATGVPPSVAGTAAPVVADATSDAEFLEAVGAYVAVPTRFGHPWMLGVGIPAVALAAGVGLWMMLAASAHRAPPSAARDVRQPEPKAVSKLEPVAPPLRPEPAPPPSTALPWRWLPDKTRLFVDSRPSRWATLPERGRLIDQAGAVWSKSMGAVLGSFGLKLDDVRRLRWASTDLGDWPGASVVVMELEQPHDTSVLMGSGEPSDLVLAGVTCRRHVNGAWPYPYAMLDRQTLITGRAELLRQLSGRSGPARQERSMEQLLLQVPARDPAFSLCLDLTAARSAGWPLPAACLDIWPEGRRAWRTLCEVPEAVGLSIEPGEAAATELWLSCETATVAEKVRAAADEILPEVRKALTLRAESITAKLHTGAIDAATADQYALLLKQAQAVAAAAKPQLVGELVYVKATWEQAPAELCRAALDSRTAMCADWYAAARACDEANYRRLLSGLGGYQKTAGSFPAGASGAVLLPAEERLSWIATMLPYYGQTDWHRRLEFAYPWNGPQNRPVTQRPLEAVVNPALGPSTTEGGFPTTHYVGVAGVGEDAGQLAADDPRAGMFGYGRATRLDQLTRGAGNTIAILGVTDRLGPWAAGGLATRRAGDRASADQGPLRQRSGRLRQRPARRNAGRDGRRLRTILRPRHRSPALRAIGHGPRRRRPSDCRS